MTGGDTLKFFFESEGANDSIKGLEVALELEFSPSCDMHVEAAQLQQQAMQAN